jgi:hypothetical protein
MWDGGGIDIAQVIVVVIARHMIIPGGGEHAIDLNGSRRDADVKPRMGGIDGEWMNQIKTSVIIHIE